MNKYILNQTPDEPPGRVFDGCAMLYRITWPRVLTMKDVCNSFVATIMHYVTPSVPLWVIFDRHDVITTTDSEQNPHKY